MRKSRHAEGHHRRARGARAAQAPAPQPRPDQRGELLVSASLRLGVILVTLSLLAGCSTIRLAYDHADAWLRWLAGNYLDVRGEQADELDERIDAFHDWHRAKALPKYARLSEEAARRLGGGLSREDIVWGYDSLMAQARESLRAAAERIAPMLDRLIPEQVRHMEKRFAEDNRKFARENLRGSEAARQEYYSLLLDRDRTLSSEQRAKAVANFRRYANDFTILGGRAAPEQ